MRFYIITGETSGDMHAANLVREMKKINTSISFRAWGGDRLISEGVSIVKHIKDTSFMGFWNVLKNVHIIKSNLSFCKNDILNFNPNALILVDYPGFNLKIAEYAKKLNIKVFYYISPKVWAWNVKRILKIKRYVDHLLVIFPFEVEFYKKHGIDAIYVGNPLLDEIDKKSFKLSFNSYKPIIALLPGSRKQEIDLILPHMLSVVDNFPNFQFIIACNNIFSKEYYNSFIKGLDVQLVFNETHALLSHSKAALITSGTATLEAAFLKVPQVVCYKTNWLTYILARVMIKIQFLSLVNIILNKDVVKELIQINLNKNNLIKELNFILNRNNNILKDYDKIIDILNKKGASNNVARYIIDTI